MRAVIYVFLFVAGGFGIFYGMRAAIVHAQSTADTNTVTITEALEAIKSQGERQVEIEKKQAVFEYRLQQDAEMNEKQSKQLEHQTKVLERIAAKLQVSTD